MASMTEHIATPPVTVFGRTPKTGGFASEISLSDLATIGVPDAVLQHPLLDEAAWVSYRDSGRSPMDCTELVTTLRSRAEFLTGAWLLDAIVPPGLGGSLLANLQPQMLKEADTLNAGRARNAILMPRRSSKTTTLWCVLMGRCYIRPVYMAGFTMLTTAKKTTERFRLDIYGPVMRRWPDKKTRPVRLINSNGFERVEFNNGSVLAILSPEGDAIRSGAYDILVCDEAGEAEPGRWEEVVAAVVPAFDTRGPGAQLVLAGTGGRYREGSYFWKTLHQATAGRIRYGVPDDIDPAALVSWESGAGKLIENLHPGLDGLTRLELIESNFGDLGADLFAREYLGHFGDEHGSNGIIPVQQWDTTTGPGAVPEGVTPAVLVFAIHPGGLWSSIGVAWHHDDGAGDLAAAAWALDGDDTTRNKVAFKLIHHQDGNARMAQHLYRYAQQLKLPIIHGDQPQEKAIVDELLANARPRPRFKLMRFGDKSVAVTKLLNGLKHNEVIHWPQTPLDKAAQIAVRTQVGKSRMIGIPDSDPTADITPLECFAFALHGIPARGSTRIAPRVVD